jgi:3-hydroxyacyl-CoA dehydrogenase
MTDVRSVAVIGTGTMGPGIGAVLARMGHEVIMHDTSPEALSKAEEAVRGASSILDRLDVEIVDGGSVRCEADLATAVGGTSLVIEAVPERLELKRALFSQVEKLAPADAILASNTSGLRITDIAAPLARPALVIGMHWSNPPHIIPMIEVVPGEQTSPEVLETVVRLIETLGYEAVIEREIPGFVENRILYAILRECLDLVEEGIIDKEGLDACVKWGIGYKLAVIGPMALIDMAGVDIYHAVASYLNQDLSARSDVAPLVGALIDERRLGVKTLGGLYDYTEESRAALAARRADTLIRVRKALSS